MQLNLRQIGSFIQKARKQEGLTQAELGERLSVTSQSVSNWERGESLPDIALLPDLAAALHCSIDTLLSGGGECRAYRRHITVAQMRGAMESLNQIGELLGRDHFMYTCMVGALNERMNTSIEPAFSDAHLFEVFSGEMLLECVRNGDYVDPRDVEKNMKPGKARDEILCFLREKRIR